MDNELGSEILKALHILRKEAPLFGAARNKRRLFTSSILQISSFDNKIWTMKPAGHYQLSHTFRNLLLTLQHEVGGRCFGHP